MPLTKQQKDKYLAQKGVECPFCGSENIEGGFVEIDDGGATQTLQCHACGKGWTDIYTLTDVEEDEE